MPGKHIPAVLLLIAIAAIFIESDGCGSQARNKENQASAKNSTLSVVEGRNADQWQTSSDKSLSFRISTNKKRYRVSKAVTVFAELKNNSASNISVFPVHCAFGNCGDAIDISGPQQVRYRGPFKSMPRPKKVTLPPGKDMIAEATIDARYEGFGVIGEYKIASSFSGLTSTVSIEIIGDSPPAKRPTPKAATRRDQLREAVKSFRLRLEYNGDQDKPYYNLTLTVPSVAHDRKNAFCPQVQITEEQAKRIIDHLATDGFLDQADDLKPGVVKKSPAPTMPGYTMKVATEQIIFLGDLGWGMPMLNRMERLRKVLDGDAATQMGLLLGRMAGHRTEWEKGRQQQE
jgi:hypothetical protein